MAPDSSCGQPGGERALPARDAGRESAAGEVLSCSSDLEAREQALQEREDAALRREETLRVCEEAQRTLAESLSLRDQMLAVLSHDLRNPLSAISMSTRVLLRAEDLAPAHLRTVGRIFESASRMERMIDQLLDFSRVRAGAPFPIERRWASLDDICRQVIEELRLVHPTRTLELEALEKFEAWGDADRLAEVFSNLISNALQHGDGGRVSVRLVREGEDLVFQVHNGGPAIPAERLSSLFQPRLGVRNKKHSGLGLGLFIVKELVTAHGGLLEVDSALETGTRFSVRLPLHRLTGAPLRAGLSRLREKLSSLREFLGLSEEEGLALLRKAANLEEWEPGPVQESGLLPLVPGPETGARESFLVWLADGVTYPHHHHQTDEDKLLLVGGLRDDDGREAWEGERVLHSRGTAHASTAIGGQGCLLAALVMPPP